VHADRDQAADNLTLVSINPYLLRSNLPDELLDPCDTLGLSRTKQRKLVADHLLPSKDTRDAAAAHGPPRILYAKNNSVGLRWE